MPLCPQITMTPIPVDQTGITMGWVKPAVFPSTSTASSLVATLYSSTAPMGYVIGQLWVDTANGNKMYRCFTVGTIINAVGNGTTITYTTDTAHGLTTGDLVTIGEINPTAYNLTAKTVASTPTTTTFTITNAATGTYVDGGWVAGWKTVQDTAIAAAQATADSAWSATLGKNTVFYQTTAPSTSGRVSGDVWFDTDDGNKMYGFNGTSWVAYQFGTASFLNASVDLSKLADGSVSAAKLIDGAVVSGKIAASAVGTNELAANSIVAGKIAASTITGDRIAAGTITATNIAAGTITSDRIAAGAITASMITSGTMSADRISGGTIASSVAIYSIDLIGTSSISSQGTLACTGAFTCTGIATFNNSINVSGITAATGSKYLVQDVNGYMRQGASVSSQRYKHSIVDLAEVPEFNPTALLHLPVRAFIYNDNVLGADDSRYQTFIPGFVAEEVDAVYPIAVDYDAQGRPDSVNAPYLIPGMLALIQQLEARIAVLEGN